MENSDKKNIEVISGNGENLDISPVSNHIPICKPKQEKKDARDIVIPTEKKRRRKQ